MIIEGFIQSLGYFSGWLGDQRNICPVLAVTAGGADSEIPYQQWLKVKMNKLRGDYKSTWNWIALSPVTILYCGTI